MKINSNSLKPGNVIKHNDRLWVIVKTQHTQPGKGGAYLQVELKDIMDNTKLNTRFRASESVERIILDETEYQFLFSEDETFTFMHPQTFEQITLATDVVGETAKYLKDGTMVSICSYEDMIISVTPPSTVVLEVIEADAVIKGQTAAASYKPATLENNEKVMVPPHITAGTKIVIDTQTNEYIERAKN